MAKHRKRSPLGTRLALTLTAVLLAALATTGTTTRTPVIVQAAETLAVGKIYAYEGVWYTGYRWERTTATMGTDCHRLTGPGNVFTSFRNRSSHFVRITFRSDCVVSSSSGTYPSYLVSPWEDVPSFAWSGGAKSAKRL